MVLGILRGDVRCSAAFVPAAHMARERHIEAGDFKELRAFPRVAKAFRLAHAVQRFSLITLTRSHAVNSRGECVEILQRNLASPEAVRESNTKRADDGSDFILIYVAFSVRCALRLSRRVSGSLVTRL